jgi:hypothetical protein
MTEHQDSQEQTLFIANIPVQIEAEWNPRYAHLAGFPLNLMYTGLRDVDGQDQARPAAACYWFDPGTYREDELWREMLYLPREESPYYVRVTVRKDTGAWDTCKYRGEALICAASGPNYEIAMLHATLAGLESDEPESDPAEFPCECPGPDRDAMEA